MIDFLSGERSTPGKRCSLCRKDKQAAWLVTFHRGILSTVQVGCSQTGHQCQHFPKADTGWLTSFMDYNRQDENGVNPPHTPFIAPVREHNGVILKLVVNLARASCSTGSGGKRPTEGGAWI